MTLQKRVKRLGVLDIGLVKWSALFFGLFLVSVWPSFATVVIQTHWGIWLGISIILALYPTYRFFK